MKKSSLKVLRTIFGRSPNYRKNNIKKPVNYKDKVSSYNSMYAISFNNPICEGGKSTQNAKIHVQTF